MFPYSFFPLALPLTPIRHLPCGLTSLPFVCAGVAASAARLRVLKHQLGLRRLCYHQRTRDCVWGFRVTSPILASPIFPRECISFRPSHSSPSPHMRLLLDCANGIAIQKPRQFSRPELHGWDRKKRCSLVHSRTRRMIKHTESV